MKLFLAGAIFTLGVLVGMWITLGLIVMARTQIPEDKT